MQQERSSGFCKHCGNIRTGLEDEKRQLGAKEKATKQEVRCGVLSSEKESRLTALWWTLFAGPLFAGSITCCEMQEEQLLEVSRGNVGDLRFAGTC